LQQQDGFGDDVETIYIGWLKEEIEPSEQDDVALSFPSSQIYQTLTVRDELLRVLHSSSFNSA